MRFHISTVYPSIARSRDPIPVTRAMFGALQRTDPRCKNRGPTSPEDEAALKQFAEVVKALTEKKN